MALTHILNARVPYVRVVASKRRAEAVRHYLLTEGFTDGDLLPLKMPAGLDIQARRGDEIALSIMAEIVQCRHNAEELDRALFQADTEAVADGPSCGCSSPAVDDGAAVIDPVCQMTVLTATAQYVSEIDGHTYYFCCSGCKLKFDADPVVYHEHVASP